VGHLTRSISQHCQSTYMRKPTIDELRVILARYERRHSHWQWAAWPKGPAGAY